MTKTTFLESIRGARKLFVLERFFEIPFRYTIGKFPFRSVNFIVGSSNGYFAFVYYSHVALRRSIYSICPIYSKVHYCDVYKLADYILQV